MMGGGGMLGNGAGLGGLPSLFGGPGSVLKILKKVCRTRTNFEWEIWC